MRRLILFVILFSAACGSPSSPTGVSERFDWTVNGQSFTASSNGRGALRAGTTLALTGAACGGGAFLGISIPSGANAEAPTRSSRTAMPQCQRIGHPTHVRALQQAKPGTPLGLHG